MRILRYLITGGLGFIGSNYIRFLLSSDTDIDVVNIDKIGYGANPDNLQDLVNEERYVFWRGDITNYEFIKPIVAESDVVVNFAAETHVDRSITDPESFIRNNYIGTYSLLEAEKNVRDRLDISKYRQMRSMVTFYQVQLMRSRY